MAVNITDLDRAVARTLGITEELVRLDQFVASLAEDEREMAVPLIALARDGEAWPYPFTPSTDAMSTLRLLVKFQIFVGPDFGPGCDGLWLAGTVGTALKDAVKGASPAEAVAKAVARISAR